MPGQRTLKIDRPVFIVGTGRSGTSLFFELLSFHPQFAWFSNYSHFYPRLHWIAMLARVHDLPFADRILRKQWRLTPKPTETYRVLDQVTESLFTAPRPLTPAEATEPIRDRFRRIVADYLRFQGKPRFASKHTGFGRIRFLDAIFPDALFIHVSRDGRAVANSLNLVDWWTGLDFWRWGEMKPEYLQEYRDSGEERIVLAGITWKTLMDAIEAECQELPPSRLHRVRYGDLIADTRRTLDDALRFCDLPCNERLERHLARQRISNMDTKWRHDLSPRQRALLESSIGPHLERYGFAD